MFFVIYLPVVLFAGAALLPGTALLGKLFLLQTGSAG